MTKEYVNKKYGKLTVLSITNKKHKRGLVLHCRCDCGNEVERISSDLTKAEKYKQESSCGCQPEKDLTGNKYGKLTAISKLYKKPGSGVVWKFKCDCGNEVERIGSHVARLEGKLHCGCSNKKFSYTKNETNNKYGKLLVIKYTRNDSKQRAMWLCKCDCGNEIEVIGARLRNGSKKHCGCKKTNYNLNKDITKTDIIPVSYYNGIKQGATNRKIIFDLTINDMHEKYIEQRGICALSGVELVPPKNMFNKNPNKASLDRIDSRKGYVIDNIQWVTATINIIKSDLKENEFVELCRKVSNYRT